MSIRRRGARTEVLEVVFPVRVVLIAFHVGEIPLDGFDKERP